MKYYYSTAYVNFHEGFLLYKESSFIPIRDGSFPFPKIEYLIKCLAVLLLYDYTLQ